VIHYTWACPLIDELVARSTWAGEATWRVRTYLWTATLPQSTLVDVCDPTDKTTNYLLSRSTATGFIVGVAGVRSGEGRLRALAYTTLGKLMWTVFSTPLSISIASAALMLRTCRLDHLSVCLYPESVLWQNGWLNPDAVWGGEWGRAWYGCIRFWRWSSKGKEQFWGEFGASHCNRWGLCDTLFSNYFEDLFSIWYYISMVLWYNGHQRPLDVWCADALSKAILWPRDATRQLPNPQLLVRRHYRTKHIT